MDAPLHTRAREILASVVREYIETGEPVGSRTISKRRRDGLSPASIRNAMADLADEGYLSQPHTSAGRVPTEKAFRYYVRSVTAGRLPSAESDRLRQQLTELHTIESRVERVSHILSEMTLGVGIAAALPSAGQELDQVELVPLAENRVLVILVTRDHMVRNRVVIPDEPMSPEELLSVRNYINRNFTGWRLGEVRREIMRRMAQERALYDAVLLKLSVLYRRGLLAQDADPEIYMDGASNLLGLDLHLTREKLRELLRALEEKGRILELLDRFLYQPGGELEVHVGLGDAHPSMKELALIGVAYAMPSGLTAKLAVLGPMRMHYERVMGAVLNLGRVLESVQF